MGMQLFLARHGETAWNLERRWQGHTDIPLSPHGREQAAALAGRLRGRGITRIRSSDLARARETAEIVARELGVPDLGVDPRLRERCFGVFEGLTAEECAERFPDVWARYQEDRRCVPPGGEPQDLVIARLEQAVREAMTVPVAADPVLLIGHGGSLRALLQAAFGRPFPPMANGCLFQIEVRDGALAQVDDLGT
jgi:2,3-bisphosphoglycerate-dependent phosphoglycerate mutase